VLSILGIETLPAFGTQAAFLFALALKQPPPLNKNQQPTQIKTPPMTTITSKYMENHQKYTVDKAPMQVDNSIKQGCNASLQGRFGKKQRH
jgi:hypothetical protein